MERQALADHFEWFADWCVGTSPAITHGAWIAWNDE